MRHPYTNQVTNIKWASEDGGGEESWMGCHDSTNTGQEAEKDIATKRTQGGQELDGARWRAGERSQGNHLELRQGVS